MLGDPGSSSSLLKQCESGAKMGVQPEVAQFEYAPSYITGQVPTTSPLLQLSVTDFSFLVRVPQLRPVHIRGARYPYHRYMPTLKPVLDGGIAGRFDLDFIPCPFQNIHVL